MIYFWEQDTRLFNVAIVVPMGVLLPLEWEEKRRACSTIHPRFQIDKSTTLWAESFIFMLIQLFFYYLFHSYSTGYSLSHRRDSLQTLQETVGETLCYYYNYILVVSIERNVWQDIFAHNRKDRAVLLLLHIIFYYIDTSVLLENIPHVKFIKTTSGTRVVYFP